MNNHPHIFSIILLNFLILITNCLADNQNDFSFTITSADKTSPIGFFWESQPQKAVLLVQSNQTFDFILNNASVIKYEPDDNMLSTYNDLTIKKELNLNDNEYLQILYGKTNQWKLYDFENFQGILEGWSNTAVSSCGTSNNKFLGGYCNFAATVVKKTWDKLPNHRMIRISFNFDFIDEWTGQSGLLKLDNKFIWQMSYTWCESVLPWYCKKFGINACGNEYPDKLSQYVEISTLHSQDTLTLEFGSTLTTDACIASWGIDDVSIYLI